MATETDTTQQTQEGEEMDTYSVDFTEQNNLEYTEIDRDNNTTNKIPVTQQLVLLAAILLLLLGGTLTPTIIGLFDGKGDAVPAAPAFIEKIEAEESEEETIKPFSEIRINAETAYVWDVQAQRALYKKDENKQVPLASVTKLMTALVAHELLTEKADIAIIDQAIKQDGDSGLLSGETFERVTLSDLVLMSSSNDGAFALASAAGSILQKDDPATAFVHAMNIRAEELSLHDTYYKNPTGLDISEEEGGAYGSAKDMAFLMEYIVVHQPEILSATTDSQSRIYSEEGFSHDAVNTNYYVNEIPGLLGSKTGYTDLAGGNLVIAFDAGLNRPIIVSVLGSSRQERFTDVLTLIKEVQRYVSQN